jgi:hypothetical protein
MPKKSPLTYWQEICQGIALRFVAAMEACADAQQEIVRQLITTNERLWAINTTLQELVPTPAELAQQIGFIRLGANQMPTDFSIQAGGAPAVVQFIPLPSGSVFALPLIFNPVADDPNVQIAPNPGDTTGTEFALTVPATDTATSFNLAVSGPLGAANAMISGTQAWTIIPAVAPPVPATSIGQQQLS